MIYRPTIRCRHPSLIYMIEQREKTAISLTLKYSINQDGKILNNSVHTKQDRQLGLCLQITIVHSSIFQKLKSLFRLSLYNFVSKYLKILLSIQLARNLSIQVAIYLGIYLSRYLSIQVSIHLGIYLSNYNYHVYLSICVSIYNFIYPYVYLSICLSI